MKFYRWIGLALFCAPAFGIAADNPFQSHTWQHSGAPVYLAATAGQLSAGQAANKVKQRYGGKVLSVTLTRSGGKPVYRVKVLTKSGVMKVVRVDGVSGRVYE
jgi:uncharacterized membrane protein YkoI